MENLILPRVIDGGCYSNPSSFVGHSDARLWYDGTGRIHNPACDGATIHLAKRRQSAYDKPHEQKPGPLT